ncbi:MULTISPECIES: SH3 domain-containing protein [unclassified Okeania]|nr:MULTISPECIES: SH3 domain-containing protein [unclassified Okeania]NEP88749.1 SH3 domain-containing protein [Okeania sp. SIO2C2]NET20400.1 SH3 domain-containing protein [Okeania sp. SIO1H5]NET77010.1 SH3 domain-containing protein [Okeania sp. SIO1F9]NET94666.1 SH3 domain-containing protein [Okeania sp. SIO1H2]
MMNWTKSVAMSTLLSIAAIGSMSLTSIAVGAPQNTKSVEQSITTIPTEGEEQLAHSYGHGSKHYGSCRRVATRHRNLRIRTYPWGRIIGGLHPGARVRVIGYRHGWARISYPYYGYVYGRYLRHC